MYYGRVYTNAFIRRLRQTYPEGTRIKLVSLYDPCCADISYGDRGTITGIDGSANISVKWDNGIICDLIYDDDIFRVID